MNEIIDCLADYLGVDANKINENSELVKELGLSSFDLIELSCELEEKFRTNINADDLVSVKYVRDLKPLIASNKTMK